MSDIVFLGVAILIGGSLSWLLVYGRRIGLKKATLYINTGEMYLVAESGELIWSKEDIKPYEVTPFPIYDSNGERMDITYKDMRA